MTAANTIIIFQTSKYLLQQTANHKIDDTILSIMLHIRKNNNRADADSIHKQIIKAADFENRAKEFLDDRIHALITVEK